MRSPFAQHGSHVPERAPGHHSVIVATAPLLCPPPSRGAELNGASGSHGCGVFLRWVLPKLVGFARICASDIDQKFTTILFYLCRRVPARLVELRAAEDSLRHLPVIPRLNRQPKLHRHCRHRVPAHHTPHPASALLCFLPTPCTGSSRGEGADQVACMDLRAMRFQWRMLQSMHMYRLPLASAHTPTSPRSAQQQLAQMPRARPGAHRQRRHAPRL